LEDMSVAGIGLGMGMECVLGLRARGVNQLCVDGATMQLAKNEGKLHAYDVTIYLMHPRPTTPKHLSAI
jgi:hypothetical protein